MKTHRFLLFIALTALLTAALCVSAGAVYTIDNGKCGNTVYWKLDSDGVLTVYGTGAMWDYGYEDTVPWENNYYWKVVISDGVTKIGNDTLDGNERLEEIEIADTVTEIGACAFYCCNSLTDVTIPDSVVTIGQGAFSYCDSLESVTIGEGVKKIGKEAFYYCSSLREVSIPMRVETIGECAFGLCQSLTAIHVDPNNPNYSSDSAGVLYNKSKTILITAPGSIESHNIPYGVETIEPNAFEYCQNLTSVTIPNSVTKIGVKAFNYCASLTHVSIPEGLTRLEDGVFASCSLTNVTIPEGVKYIGEDAFNGCEFTTIRLPDSVTTISPFAFYDCQSLESIVIPVSVTRIGYSTFDDCESLTDVYYTGNAEHWKRIDIGEENDPLLRANIHYNYTADLLGDVTGDGRLDNTDLVNIARYVVGLTRGEIKTAVEQNADMNGDNRVDNTDLVTVARIIVEQ